MLNYWWVTRPKRRLDSVPEVLAVFAGISLNQEWSGQRNTHLSYEDALERAGLKRVGLRRDQSGSGGRTYGAWLQSLGLIFKHSSTGTIKLTLAGEAIMNGKSPTTVLKEQILKYQFPSAFSVSRGVQVNERFKVHPFRFLFRLLMDNRIGYLTQSEIARIVIVEAENDTDKCFEYIVNRILEYRSMGDACLSDDFLIRYKPGRGTVNPNHPFSHLEDVANTMINWMEYTQLARRDENRRLEVLPSAIQELLSSLSAKPSFIDRPFDHEYFQRKYGLDPWHKKDTRNLENTRTVTEKILAQHLVKQAYVTISLKRPIVGITQDLIVDVSNETGIVPSIVSETLEKLYPHGSIGAFMNSYFEMAFSGRDEAVEFEKATTDIFKDVFGYNAIHLGQTGSKSAPDILLISDSDGYQSIIDNKAYSAYSISGDHHNRMVHNYIKKIASYSQSPYPIGYFSYIAGGFGKSIDKQIKAEVSEAGVHGSGITVSTFIKMIENQTEGRKVYSHHHLRQLFGIDRQVMVSDI